MLRYTRKARPWYTEGQGKAGLDKGAFLSPQTRTAEYSVLSNFLKTKAVFRGISLPSGAKRDLVAQHSQTATKSLTGLTWWQDTVTCVPPSQPSALPPKASPLLARGSFCSLLSQRWVGFLTAQPVCQPNGLISLKPPPRFSREKAAHSCTQPHTSYGFFFLLGPWKG